MLTFCPEQCMEFALTTPPQPLYMKLSPNSMRRSNVLSL